MRKRQNNAVFIKQIKTFTNIKQLCHEQLMSSLIKHQASGYFILQCSVLYAFWNTTQKSSFLCPMFFFIVHRPVQQSVSPA